MAEGEAAVSSTKYDVVVFGASGFTGQHVVAEVARTVGEEAGGLTWAIAGRSMSKLQGVLARAGDKTGKNLEEIPILIADVTVESSLADMAKQARVLLNCVGPYRFYGDVVVKACVEAGTHHLDISGEPYFLEKCQLLYDSPAKKAGIYVIGTCGFDSIPAEMGIQYTKDKFEAEKGDLNAVEGYLSMKGGPSGMVLNFGTFQSVIYGVSQGSETQAQRKQLYSSRAPKPQHSLPKRGFLHFNEDVNSWCVPFLGSDKSVAYRTQRFNIEHEQRPVQFYPYFRIPTLFTVFLLAIFGAVFGTLASFRCGRWLLEQFPSFFSGGYFSKDGPSEQQIAEASISYTFVGTGYENKKGFGEEHEDHPRERIVTRVSGPEAGYVLTPISLVQCAYTLLAETDKLPQGGGVLTPGAAFARTSLIKRLDDHGIKFSVVEQAKS